MNLKEIRNLYKYDCVIRQLYCTKCKLTKFVVPYYIDELRHMATDDIDKVSKYCNKPDYRL